MALVADLVLQTANNPGTGTFNLIPPPASRISFFAGCGIGQAYYFASDGVAWEKGIGTVASGSPDTLSRDTVLGNSLGTTAKINFTGAVTLVNDIPAERDIWANAVGDAVLVGGRKLSGLVAGVDVADAPRMDQIAEQRIGTYTVSGGIIVVPIPSIDRYKIDLRSLTASTTAGLYVRLSVDGGTTYKSGASDYNYGLLCDTTSATIRYPGPGSIIPLSQPVSPFSAMGHIIIDAASTQLSSHLGLNAERDETEAWWAFGPPTHLLIGAVSATLTAGSARLAKEAW